MKCSRFYIVVLLIAAVFKGAAQSNIEFVENKGQWDSRVKFKGEIKLGAFFLEKTGFTVLLRNPDDLQRITDAHHNLPPGGGNVNAAPGVGNGSAGGGKAAAAQPDKVRTTATGGKTPYSPGAPPEGGGTPGEGGGLPPNIPGGILLHSHAYRVSFAGANENPTIIPDKPLPGYNNYFIGNDTSQWRGNCRIYQGVTYKDLYPNIDIRYYTSNEQLKYDIIVHPGGDVNRIRMKYEGADKLTTKKDQLVVSTSVGPVTQLAPYSYLFDQRGRTDINCRYTITGGNTVGFRVADHDPAATLIIDPTLVFCTFTGSKTSNWGFTATPGPDGSFFSGGIVFGSAYPWTMGALQPVFGGGQIDVGIMKFNSSGSAVVYATYIGGGDSELPHSLICDAQGGLVVLGRTYSSNFPHKVQVGSGGGADMFVVKINPAGNALVGCLVIGGSGDDCVNMRDEMRASSDVADTLIRNYGDDSRSEVILDGSNNILITASTQSSGAGGSGAFPIMGSVFQPSFGGGRQDAVVLKIDPTCNNVLWSSFLGGLGADAGFVLKVNPGTGDIYVAGATNSSSPLGPTAGVIQAAYGGGICDGFIAMISPDGGTLKKFTYLGTDAPDAIYGIQFDKKGFPYVMGTTGGPWTVLNAAYSIGGGRQFVGKLQPDLSAYIFSTTFGTPTALSHSNPNISPVAFLVDRCENMYISGWGGWIIGGQVDPYKLVGTLGMPVTTNAIKRSSDNRDFYFIVIQKNAAALLYGTFFGEDDSKTTISEHVDGGTSRYDANGIIYQAICANCSGNNIGTSFTTPGVWAPRNGATGQGCNLAALKIAFNFAGVAAGLRASVNGRLNDTAGCVPLDTQIEDTIRNAKSYIWNFGDGGPDTATTGYVVHHTYVNPGIYKIMMIAIDSNSCNGADTAYRYVIGRTDRADLQFTYGKAPDAPCTSLSYLFDNISGAPSTKPFGPTSFIWDFGDHTGRFPAGLGAVEHAYASTGTYIVNLVLTDTAYCNWPDSIQKTLRVSPLAKAQFVTPATGCAPYNAIINNTSLGGIQFFWDFGDGQTSTDPNPTHLYASPGTYTISLLELDSTTCNGRDSTSYTITVSGRPRSAFTASTPEANKPVIFTNGSTGGISYDWTFGDGDSAVRTTLDTVQHIYIRTDSFQVCLVTTNEFTCTDTACHSIETIINPLLDVPNAFTPGRFGTNSVVKVMGFGITHMTFRIYNRFGKIVFQSDDPDIGWDGYYQGVMQPMDVYAYTLEADLSNGAHVSKKGDITLVR